METYAFTCLSSPKQYIAIEQVSERADMLLALNHTTNRNDLNCVKAEALVSLLS